MNPLNAPQKTVWLIYDGDCPICSATANGIQIQKAAGNLLLVNARNKHPILETIKNKGLNLDKGIVVINDQQFFHGAAAINFLALIGTSSNTFNKLNVILFRNKYLANTLYPVLCSIRNCILKLKGVSKINDD